MVAGVAATGWVKATLDAEGGLTPETRCVGGVACALTRDGPVETEVASASAEPHLLMVAMRRLQVLVTSWALGRSLGSLRRQRWMSRSSSGGTAGLMRLTSSG